ncbi:MAG: hypothetical protein IV092_26405 [Burkholderiaceae bacterium]|nr:hypothetical protein [Burkholderiaceae bacterium]
MDTILAVARGLFKAGWPDAYRASRRRKTAAEAGDIAQSTRCGRAPTIALAHGINANIVHRWRQLLREGRPSVPAILRGFVPGSLATTPSASPPIAGTDIQIELRRGAIAMTINWPTSAAAEFAARTRELLR